ncbi:MAG: tetratricopeptide repeat protein [Candidatus Aminicenantes bacterium]|nr:tetratricopeptide repeat protein [Candidatus Aminicenantes bacterium]
MKKITALVSILFLCSALWGGETAKNNYEDYIVIKYLLTSGDYTGAETVIDNYLKKYPDDPFILTEKAGILKNIKNDYKNALKLIEKSKKIYPGYYYSNYLHASLLFAGYIEQKKNKHLVDKAAEYLKISLQNNKDFYSSYYLLGVILSETGKYEESNKYFELSNRLRETPEAYYNLSFNYKELGDLEKELKTYKKILEFDSNNYNIIYTLARAYLKKKDFEKATAYLKKLFLRNRENKDISLKYLYALFASGKRDKFLEISEKIDISGSSLLLYARAFVLSTKDRFAEAEKLLQQVKDKDLKANILLADIYYRKQEYYRGYRLLQKIPRQERDTIYYSLLLEMLSGLNLNRKISAVFDFLKKDKATLGKLAVEDYYNILLAFSSLKEIENIRRAVRLFYETRRDKPGCLDELLRLLRRFSQGREIAVEKLKFRSNLFLIIGLYKSLSRYDKAASLLKKVIKLKTIMDP